LPGRPPLPRSAPRSRSLPGRGRPRPGVAGRSVRAAPVRAAGRSDDRSVRAAAGRAGRGPAGRSTRVPGRASGRAGRSVRAGCPVRAARASAASARAGLTACSPPRHGRDGRASARGAPRARGRSERPGTGAPYPDPR